MDANFTKWFNYMLNFMDTCIDNSNFNLECSKQVQTELGIDTAKVDECFRNSFARPGID